MRVGSARRSNCFPPPRVTRASNSNPKPTRRWLRFQRLQRPPRQGRIARATCSRTSQRAAAGTPLHRASLSAYLQLQLRWQAVVTWQPAQSLVTVVLSSPVRSSVDGLLARGSETGSAHASVTPLAPSLAPFPSMCLPRKPQQHRTPPTPARLLATPARAAAVTHAKGLDASVAGNSRARVVDTRSCAEGVLSERAFAPAFRIGRNPNGKSTVV